MFSRECVCGHRWQEAEAGSTPCPSCRKPPDGLLTLTPDTMPKKAEPLLPRVPGCEILGRLGEGAFGVVYRARQTKLDRVVAVKTVSAEYVDETDTSSFSAEAKAVAELNHPNIVQIHDYGTTACEGKRPYFVMEYVEGGTLERKLRDGRPKPREAAALARALAEAVHYAHGRGIVHRDLKPANVMLTKDGTPKVTDFGLFARPGEGVSMDLTGTPGYAAPEQYGGPCGPSCDVWALGVILYECLAGRRPFVGETLREIEVAVRYGYPAPPLPGARGTLRDLETVCLKCLEKDPGHRYAGAKELADDLGRWVADEPIQARRVGRIERAVRWVKKRRAPVSVMAAAVLLALLAVSWALLRPKAVRTVRPEDKVEYFRAMAYRWGEPVGVGPLTPDEAAGALRAYRFAVRDGQVAQVDVIDRGMPTPTFDSWVELGGLSALGLMREGLTYRFAYENGRVTRQDAYRLDKQVWSLSWRSDSSADLFQGEGAAERRRTFSVRWDERGHLAEVRGDLVLTCKCDSRGLVVKGAGGELDYDDDGACVGQVTTINGQTERVRFDHGGVGYCAARVIDAEGRPSVEAGYSEVVFELRRLADGVEVAASTFDGRKAAADAATGVHRSVTRYDSKDRILEEAYFDAKGREAWHRKDQCMRVVHHYRAGELASTSFEVRDKGEWKARLRRDGAGRVVEEAFYSPDCRRVCPKGHGCHRLAFTYRDGFVFRDAFDEDGKPARHAGTGAHRYVCRPGGPGNAFLFEGHYGPDHRPTIDDKDGVHQVRRAFAQDGRALSEDYFGTDGKHANNHVGFARAQAEWGPQGKVALVLLRADRSNQLYLWKRLDPANRPLLEVNLDANGDPFAHADGWHRIGRRIDARGNEIERAYFGPNGEPVADVGGVHRQRFRFDAAGVQREVVNLGLDGSPVTDRRTGVCREVMRDEGRVREYAYFGPSGRHARPKGGHALLRQALDAAGKPVEEWAYWADPSGKLRLRHHRDVVRDLYREFAELAEDGQPVLSQQGHHRIERRFDRAGRVVEEVVFGLDGGPTLIDQGFHVVRSRYDADGRLAERAHFGTNGEPVRHREGFFRCLNRYDDKGETTEHRRLGPDDKPTDAVTGWAMMRYGTRDGRRTSEGFDRHGTPVKLEAVVSAVTPNTTAERAGLRRGDVLAGYRGRPIDCLDAFFADLAAATEPADLQVRRDGQVVTLRIDPKAVGISAGENAVR